ncbi:hypothetical protein [Methylobacterium nonmethylotrophicum]|uniref:Uncharacterized protein n=1 Tax=Methylobacterium nonmethylotrophicum TaxID=1141884 RepID=A0A4Z0NK96_9HYPH|nr:hypothetical protein [Methylobacterium nonmethylotrophicum]TGD96793.1 hypothetical protein EU555_22340 [Methylobacterium nonmethylotrophicum]
MSDVFDDKVIRKLESLGLGNVPRFVVKQGKPTTSSLSSGAETIFAARSLGDAVRRMSRAVDESSAYGGKAETTKGS